MTILAFEFSSPQRRVAVLQADAVGRELHADEVIDASPERTSRPLGMVEDVLREAGAEREQIDCVAVGLGSGSYTGIRAAIALAQGWQLARGVKLFGISSVECIAGQAHAEGLAGKFSVVIDAQREEFYLGGWEVGDGRLQEMSPLRLATRADVDQRAASGEMMIGPEITRWFPSGRIVRPSALTLARIARQRTDYVAGEKLEPIYLRETAFVKAPPPRVVPG